MKKRVKKLSLSKETINNLDKGDLTAVRGGNTGANTTCPCFDGSWCDCTAQGCTGATCR